MQYRRSDTASVRNCRECSKPFLRFRASIQQYAVREARRSSRSMGFVLVRMVTRALIARG